MRLSEAMILGEVGWPRNDGYSFFGDEDGCGCAIGRAWYAEGKTSKDWFKKHPQKSPGSSALAGFFSLWPWLGDGYGISSKFLDVLNGNMAFDQLVDYVRSIEPDCDCCRFNCDCKAAEAAVTEMETTHADA